MQVLDFSQLARTHGLDLIKINVAFGNARTREIAIADLEHRRDELRTTIAHEFGGMLTVGGEQQIEDATRDGVHELFKELASIWFDLDGVLKAHDHYVENKGRFDAHVAYLDERPKKVRIADGVQPNRILEGLVRHASDYQGLLDDTRRHFAEALDALKSRNLVRYHGEMRMTNRFGNQETFITRKLESGELVRDDFDPVELRKQLLDHARTYNWFGFQGLIAEYAESDFVWDDMKVERVRVGAVPVAVFQIAADSTLVPVDHNNERLPIFFCVLQKSLQLAIGYADEHFAEIVDLDGDFGVLID